ncbi:MAG: 2-oxo acid dehydrogenase subunit E2 [Bacillaceae bacterium]|nr:2-oxo acid dehydrogenase subunit E2 [Bacillaceae bacterium]
MAQFEFKLPELGEGIHEGEILKWLIKPGDEVKEDDVIAEVQNDKAVVEIPSPVDGKVLDIKVDEGTVATVGDVLVIFETEQARPSAKEAEPVDTPGEPEQPDQSDKPNQSGEQPAASLPPADKKVLATPGTRKLARELGIEIARVPGTGRNGQVTREDVRQFAEQQNDPSTQAEPAVTETPASSGQPERTHTEQREERVPLKGIRKVISEAMVKSKYTAPHVTLMDEVDVTELVNLREEAKPLAEQRGIRLTYLPFVVKALIAALKKYPVLNASLDDEKDEIVYKKYYNIGIATDTENGLLVPVIFDADRKNIWTIADEIRDLAGRAREGKLQPHELKGSTISITNIGTAGGMFFTPVINYPEVAILGTGKITEKPVAKDGEVVIAPVMALSLSFDHRIIDGATAQYFLNDVKQFLENPKLLVMEV